MTDQTVFLAIVVLFALAVTAHVAIAVGLLRLHPRWRGPVAFFVPPLAPYWALRNRMPARAIVWLAAVAGYLLVRVLFRG
jgi:hypothetical protein